MKIRINKLFIKCIIFVVLFLLLTNVILNLLHVWEIRQSQACLMQIENTGDTVGNNEGLTYYNDKWYEKNESIETVLIIGIDKFSNEQYEESYNNFQQADFIMLLIINHDKNVCSLIQLNRDTMTEIQALGTRGEQAGTFVGQLALAHTYGSGGKDSCENTVDAVSNLLYGINIDHYLSLTMDAVETINDLVGGVTVTVLDDFSDMQADLIKGNTVTLEGEDTLAYLRTRKGLEDSSNLHRMERQRQYLTALKDNIYTCVTDDSDFILNMMVQISPNMVSDCTANELSYLYEALYNYKVEEISTLEGKEILGDKYIEYYVDEDYLRNEVIKLFYTLK